MRMTTVCGERGQFGAQHDRHAFYSTKIWPGLMVADQHQPAATDQRGCVITDGKAKAFRPTVRR